MALGISASAQAYSGRTTKRIYPTGSEAALHTGAYYMSQAALARNPKAKPYHASDMKIEKMGKTKAGTVTSTWTLLTKSITPMGYPTARVTVKIKKLSDHKWKGYSNGKTTVSYFKTVSGGL